MKAGDSAAPADIMKPLGIDLKDTAFWLGGVKIIRDMVKETISMK
jgi:oligoendopeptidase F